MDILQPAVASGNPYVVPPMPPANALVISSWSTNAAAGEGQIYKMKVFRQVSGLTYMVVGHDGPRTLTGGTLNTFTGISIPVQPGDVLGLNDNQGAGAPNACSFSGPGSQLQRLGDLFDGASEAFNENNLFRTNITAVVTPSNSFSFGKTTLNKKKGTATLKLTLPNPGELTASGNGVKASSASRAVISKAVGAGPATLLIKAKGKKRKTLNATGKVKLNVAVTYTPTGGDPSTQSRKLKLRKRQR